MAGFIYRLEQRDGTPADPPALHTAVPTWNVGDAIPLGAGRTLSVVEIRPGRSPEDEPVLVVEIEKSAS